jgi:hypothetical protein
MALDLIKYGTLRGHDSQRRNADGAVVQVSALRV